MLEILTHTNTHCYSMINRRILFLDQSDFNFLLNLFFFFLDFRALFVKVLIPYCGISFWTNHASTVKVYRITSNFCSSKCLLFRPWKYPIYIFCVSNFWKYIRLQKINKQRIIHCIKLLLFFLCILWDFALLI